MALMEIHHHLSPGKLIFGPQALGELPAELDREAAYLVVTDRGVAEAGTAARTARLLDRAKIRHQVFDQVTADPSVEVVEAAVKICLEENLSGVIGLGGGSPMDAAKAVAVRLTQPHSLREYGDGRPVEGPIAPLFVAPTTAGTGSEATRVAVITDASKPEKMAIRGVHLAPRAAVLDPLLLASLPPRVAAETGADALTHAVEAFVSRGVTALTDAIALAAIRLIGRHFRAFVADPADQGAAEKMLLASCLAGQAFSNAGLGLTHSLGELLGANFHVPHGLAMALYLPHVMDFNRPAAPKRFAAVAQALGGEAAGAVEAVRKLFADVGLPRTYAEADVEFILSQEMIDDVWPQSCTQANPREADPDQVVRLFEAPGPKAVP